MKEEIKRLENLIERLEKEFPLIYNNWVKVMIIPELKEIIESLRDHSEYFYCNDCKILVIKACETCTQCFKPIQKISKKKAKKIIKDVFENESEF
jgi:hypothetical protein